MLRDYPFTLDPQVFKPVFEQFNLERPQKATVFALLEFKMITPNSFIWKFLIDKAIYYLYAEDYIQSFDDVATAIKSHTKYQSNFDFITVKKLEDFEQTGPAQAAVVYEQPEDYETMKLYAAHSGSDFVFLVQSKEDAGDAYFSRMTS